jgi:hypothetical protein
MKTTKKTSRAKAREAEAVTASFVASSFEAEDTVTVY